MKYVVVFIVKKNSYLQKSMNGSLKMISVEKLRFVQSVE